MSFLTAEWRKLILVNYTIDESLLMPYVPAGTEIDKWNGEVYVSLVGFMFLNTKLLGIKIPFHTNFEEVNLRFYVRYKDGQEWKRGVVFIKEIVPKPALTLVANMVYGEHYKTMPMRHKWEESNKGRKVEYHWKYRGKWQKMSVTSELNSHQIKNGTEEEFISEHYWGYTKINDTTTHEYEVTHPSWEYYRIRHFDIDVNFGQVYGDEFEFLNIQAPKSVMLMEGSKITVENKRKIKLD